MLRHLRSDRGATAVEYGLLLALIAAVIIGVVVVAGHQVSNAFNSYGSQLQGAQGNPNPNPNGSPGGGGNPNGNPNPNPR